MVEEEGFEPPTYPPKMQAALPTELPFKLFRKE